MNSGINSIVLNEISKLAAVNGIEKVILFGSRARGDYYETSDIDLAVNGGNISEFTVAVDEETSTLLKFDIVDLSSMIRPELRESIERDGVIIYEKI